MANKLNIDELLKQELADFHPDAPSGAWDAINQSLPNAAAQTAVTTGKVGAMATVKIVAAIVTIAASATAGLFLLSNKDKTATKSAINSVAPIAKSAHKNEPQVTPSDLEVINKTSEPNEPKTNKNLPSEQTRSVKNQQPVITTNSDVKSAVVVTQPIETSDRQNGETLDIKQELVSGELVDRNQTETKSTEEQKPAVTDYFNEYSEPNIPNVFTPNNDGYNDEYVITIENEIMYDLKIMDAKGNVVFESKDKNMHWGGVNQRSGNICEPGVYVFAFRYQLKGMNEAKVKQGRILLKL